MMKNRQSIFLLLLCLTAWSCNNYLDVRPYKSQVVPKTLADCQALLDNLGVMNRSFGSYGEAATDDYYVTQASYNSLLFAEDKSLYIWDGNGQVSSGQWLGSYKVVFYANLVLETAGTASAAAPVRGAALFFRGYAHFEVASLFGQPYVPATAATNLGVPLRLSSDFNQQSVRATNRETYDQVLGDLRQAAALLPMSSTYPTRPNRLSAYAAIARVSLAMSDYRTAGLYADSCLAGGLKLIDYNTLDTLSPNPFARYNQETVFSALSGGSSLLTSSRCRPDTLLLAAYGANDLRKALFFRPNGFKNNYDGEQSSSIFTGIALDEVYLIAAEAAARQNDPAKAMRLLNMLLVTRWKTGTYQPMTAADVSTALKLVLVERRKELVLRGTRWQDLRRLNQDPAYQTVLKRNLSGVNYSLQPGDKRYALLIPQSVITLTGMPQNER